MEKRLRFAMVCNRFSRLTYREPCVVSKPRTSVLIYRLCGTTAESKVNFQFKFPPLRTLFPFDVVASCFNKFSIEFPNNTNKFCEIEIDEFFLKIVLLLINYVIGALRLFNISELL